MSGRIEVLSAELADQIAAGEVVERPASVVKELIENSIDAGATRVSVQLEDAGLARIVVVDDGRGIHPDDLALALTRHATSKLRRPADLVDVATLGFRGEALASVAAVADVVIDSRTPQAGAGQQLRSRPGLAPVREPVGMPPGTRVELSRLFGNVPARRKFMRSHATEVGHCIDTVLRAALVHPDVTLELQSDGRELLRLAAAPLGERVAQVLRGHTGGPLEHVAGDADGVSVQAWLGPAELATRSRTRAGLYIVVRRRVVRDRSLAQIVAAAYGEALPGGTQPAACVFIEPPPATVDVNVHPQKSEIRFSDPQLVYAAVRRVLATWSAPALEPAPSVRFGGALRALDAWDSDPQPTEAASYSLRTRAASQGYRTARAQVRAEVEELRALQSDADPGPVAPRESEPEPAPPPFELLTCLPGPVAVLRDGDDLLVADLRELRSHLVYRRLTEGLGGDGVPAQGLLTPATLTRSPQDVRLCAEAGDALKPLGLVVEAFGDDGLIVRAVPASLRQCVEEPDVADLLDRVLPWLRLRARGRAEPAQALQAMARTRGADPAPRLARRWLRELADLGVRPDDVPGVRRWTGAALLGRS